MLTITVDDREFFDESTSRFFTLKGGSIQLEHSLVSLSKWESKWHRSFLEAIENEDLSVEESNDYIRCMTITQNVKEELYTLLFTDNSKMKEIINYISNPMTATTFAKDSNSSDKKEIVTSELIYYWMTAFNIPPEYQKWHLNRLTTLIRICNIKNQPPKKMTQREIAQQNARLNAERRKKFNSKG